MSNKSENNLGGLIIIIGFYCLGLALMIITRIFNPEFMNIDSILIVLLFLIILIIIYFYIKNKYK